MMLARTAEYLFWAGRYLERAEDTARLLDVTYHRLLEATPGEETAADSSMPQTYGLSNVGNICFSRSRRRRTVNGRITLPYSDCL